MELICTYETDSSAARGTIRQVFFGYISSEYKMASQTPISHYGSIGTHRDDVQLGDIVPIRKGRKLRCDY